jgi:hypothetical protein
LCLVNNTKVAGMSTCRLSRPASRSNLRTVNRILAMAVYIQPLLGVHFLRGRFSLKNRSYRPLLRANATPFHGTCLFYILKKSHESFVWAAPPLLRGGQYLINEENTLRGANTVRVLNPARVKAREAWHDSISNIQIHRSCIEYRNTHISQSKLTQP